MRCFLTSAIEPGCLAGGGSFASYQHGRPLMAHVLAATMCTKHAGTKNNTGAPSWWCTFFSVQPPALLPMAFVGKAAANPEDPRHQGWPCHGDHKESTRGSNQHGTWENCARCGLRLSYMAKPGSTGKFRTMGPAPHVVEKALIQLRHEGFSDKTLTAQAANKQIRDPQAVRACAVSAGSSAPDGKATGASSPSSSSWRRPLGNKPNRKIIYTTGAGDDIEQEARAKSIMAAWGDLVFKVMKKVTRLDRFKQRLDSARNC